MVDILDFFSERARGLLLTVTGTGVGSISNIMGNILPADLTVLEKLQFFSYSGAITVAALTTIAYLYKFYIWVKPYVKRCIGKKR